MRRQPRIACARHGGFTNFVSAPEHASE
jgi:hypothetical protein